MCKCVCGCLFVCRVSLFFLGWLVIWVYGLCVLLCFSALAAHVRALLVALETFFVFFLHFGRPLDSIVALGAPLCHLSWSILQVFRTWWHLGAQVADSWLPFGRLWGPFWGTSMALEPTLDVFFDFSGKTTKKV